jgi:4-diphosphocytidyl-2-C-methyl-D-erythritol kinase
VDRRQRYRRRQAESLSARTDARRVRLSLYRNIFHRVELADEIAVHAEDDRLRAIDVQEGDAGPAEENLAYRAAVAYQEEASWPRGFTIELDKKIPIGAGLGGGSADAGAVLRALDSISRKPLGEKKLRAIAASLGSDVPFLVSREPMALAWGRGERMLGLSALPQRDVLLVIPDFSVPYSRRVQLDR